MGKRSSFDRVPRDYYPTPLEAVKPLVGQLPNSFTFCEPCAGDGRLISHLEVLFSEAECTYASDVEPRHDDVEELDALDLTAKHVKHADFIITNPPWIRTPKSGMLLHQFITTFSNLRPTWLLFDADWAHTIQASELIKTRLVKIVSIGRVKWIEDSKNTGKDNCCWYMFDVNKQGPTEFIGR